MKKTVIVLLGLFTFILFTDYGYAKETYYYNNNGVSMSQKEYDFLSSLYWDGYQQYITKEQFDAMRKDDLFDKSIISDIYYPLITPFATSFSDSNKTLKISKVCSTKCIVSVTLKWNNSPNLRSYDVIGVYFTNTNLIGTPTTLLTSSSGSSNISDNIKQTANGYGVSFKLPASGNNITITQTYQFTKSGNVYASYQHAISNISLNDSKNYTFSRNGYGGVFKFSGIALTTYDRMNGVNISLN